MTTSSFTPRPLTGSVCVFQAQQIPGAGAVPGGAPCLQVRPVVCRVKSHDLIQLLSPGVGPSLVSSLSSSFGKPVAPPTIPASCQAPPEGDIITALLDDAQADEVASAPAPPPPPPPQASVTDLSGPPPAPPLILETGAVFVLSLHLFSSRSVTSSASSRLSVFSVVEENSFPSPSPPPPPPPSDEDAFPPLPNDGSELPAPPPSQEVDGICFSVRLSVLPLSLFFFAGVCLAVLFHCSFFSGPPVQEESRPPTLAPSSSLCLSESPLWPRLPLPLHALSLPACCPIT